MVSSKKKIAGIMLALITIQMIGVGIVDLGVAVSLDDKTGMQSPVYESENQPSYPSHATSYRWEVDRNSPIYTEWNEGDESEDLSLDSVTPESSLSPRSQYWWDTDYALSINLAKYAFTQGEDIQIEFQVTYNLTPVDNYAINVQIFSGYWRNWYYYYGYYYENNPISPVFETTVYTNEEGRAVLTITQTLPEGMYTVYVNNGDINNYKEFTVGDEGIFVKAPRYYKAGQEFRAGVHLVDLSDFSPLPNHDYNYSLSYYEWSGDYYDRTWINVLEGNGTVDSNGYDLLEFIVPDSVENKYYLQLKIQIPGTPVVFSMFLYQSWEYYYYSFRNGEQSMSDESIQYVVTTDKTIYSLGETLHLRALVLDYSFMNETRTPLVETPIKVAVYNPDEFAVFWTEIMTDSSGVLTFEFPFSQDTDIGTYNIQFEYQNNTYSYPVKVQYYEKPVFRVSIDTYGKIFFPESYNPFEVLRTVYEGDVIAEFYFGQPVVGAEVELQILNYNGEIVYTETGITNALGKYHFSVNLYEIQDLHYTFSVKAIVTDEYGRSADSLQTYTRIRDTYIWGYTSPWNPSPSDSITYYFYANQFVMRPGGSSYWDWEMNPLANVSVSIKIYGLTAWWFSEDVINSKKYITTLSGTTNQFGAGTVEFSLDFGIIAQYYSFQIECTMKLEDGRSATAYDYFRYKKYSLDIDLDKDVYSKGDTIQISALYWDEIADKSAVGEGKLYLYDSNYQLIGKSSRIFNGQEQITFKLSQYAKEGRYYIYSYVYSESNDWYRGFTYQSAYVRFQVGESHTIQLETNITAKDESGRRFVVNSGDIVHISGNSDVPTNNLHYIEIYKRGLIFSEPLEVNGGTFSYELPVEASFIPDFTVFVYTISTTGKIIEDYLVFHVNISSGFTLTTDKEVYEPGDTMTLTITPTSETPTLVSVSFIDSSVLDVEPEDDSELAYFSPYNYAAYLQSSSSWGVGYDGSNYWWIGYGSPNGWWYWPLCDCGYMYDDVAYDAAEGGINLFGDVKRDDAAPEFSFSDIISSFDTEIRKNITESANWNPKLWITEPTNITYKLPDNIGEWTIRVVGAGIDQEMGMNVVWGDVQTVAIKSFLPFFVEYEVPQPITQDDIVAIKAYIYNYIGQDTTALVAINAPGMIILNNEVQEIFVPSNMVAEVEFSAYCKDPFSQNVTIVAAANTTLGAFSDAKLDQFYVKPNGLEINSRQIGLVNASESMIINYTIENDTIYHREKIAIYSDLMDISFDSWKSLIGYPYGCVEQTVSKLLPSVLIYQYLKVTGELTDDIEIQINQIVAEGLNRLYSMQHSDGGWGWWYDDESRIYMTSIVLSALIEIDRSGFYINPSRFESAVEYLLDMQNQDGSWSLSYYYGETAFEATAFIANMLKSQQITTMDLTSVLSHAFSFLAAEWDAVNYRGPYGAALYYLAARNTAFEDTDRSTDLINYLLDSKHSQNGEVFWTFSSSDYWYWGYFGGTIEITANVIMALAEDDFLGHFPLLQKATQFLLSHKGRYGWWTTADTSSAIRALIFMKNRTITSEIVEFNGTLDIVVNDEADPLYQLNYTGEWIPAQIQLLVSSALETGNNTINLNSTGNGKYYFMLETTQIVRAEPLIEIPSDLTVSPGSQFNFSVAFRDIPLWYSLNYVSIELEDINPEFSINTPETENIYIEKIPVGNSQANFVLNAPINSGTYTLGQVKISGDLIYTNLEDNSTSLQHFQKQLGPIYCEVSASPASSAKSVPVMQVVPLSSNGGSPRLVSKDGISLSKSFDVRKKLFGGDVITVTIEIDNNAQNRQFYALDDEIPEGTEYIPESLQISSNNGGDFPVEIKPSKIHVYFAQLPSDTITITYQIQVIDLKNSYGGKIELWGMYDKYSLQTGGENLENIPVKYSVNNEIYRDVENPVISDCSISDLTGEIPKVKLSFDAADDNEIFKVRVFYLQANRWTSLTFYNKGGTDNLNIVVDTFENIDSEVTFIIQVFDNYGNVAQYFFDPFKIFSTLPPYATIGIIIGVSLGIAGIAYLYSKKPEALKKILPPKLVKDKKMTKLDSNKKFSFIDDSDSD